MALNIPDKARPYHQCRWIPSRRISWWPVVSMAKLLPQRSNRRSTMRSPPLSWIGTSTILPIRWCRRPKSPNQRNNFRGNGSEQQGPALGRWAARRRPHPPFARLHRRSRCVLSRALSSVATSTSWATSISLSITRLNSVSYWHGVW